MTQPVNPSIIIINTGFNGNVNASNGNYYLLNQPMGDSLQLSNTNQQAYVPQNQFQSIMLQIQLMILRLLISLRMMDVKDNGSFKGCGGTFDNFRTSKTGKLFRLKTKHGNGEKYFGKPVKDVKSAPAGKFAGTKLTQEQVKNAKIIADVGKQKGASKRDIQIAIATAMQESGLRNIDYGDRDSVGLFQQRPSCGWGSVEECTTPEYAAGKFFDCLMENRNRDNMSLTAAAQKVQRSAYPDAYAKWEAMAEHLTDAMVA